MLISKALSLGASDARIISTALISIQDEIIEMCRSPLCEGFGQCANCPPHVMSPNQSRPWIKGYDEALLIKMDLDPGLLFGPNRLEPFKKMFLLVTTLERLARASGAENAFALGAGSCKPVLCGAAACAVLDGEQCRYSDLARPSLEAVGINVFRLFQAVGWPMHKILRGTDPKTVPSASLAGLVLF